jgi:hypothetical protein
LWQITQAGYKYVGLADFETRARLTPESYYARTAALIFHSPTTTKSGLRVVQHTKKLTYVGFMLEILSPFEDLTHSLLINRPVGCVYLTPLGAVSSTDKPDILRIVTVKNLDGAGYVKEKEAEERRRKRYI